mmetsp:Transcript_22734/g.45487  ORF Transcript_22734/g.45487 Transcript_22734/m.45487 type:complete len:298 (-) Transcript_22734:138-1031(-)
MFHGIHHALVLRHKLRSRPVSDNMIEIASPQIHIPVAALDRQLPRLERHHARRVRALPQIDEQHVARLVRHELLLHIFKNPVRQRARRALVQQALHRDPRHPAPPQEHAALRVRVVRGHRHHPVLGGGAARARHPAHVAHHHARRALHRDGDLLVRETHAARDPARVVREEGEARVPRHFGAGAGGGEGEADQTFHGGEGVLEVGDGDGGRVLAHTTVVGETDHRGVEAVGVAVEYHIHTTAARRRHDGVGVAQIEAHHTHLIKLESKKKCRFCRGAANYSFCVGRKGKKHDFPLWV